MSKIPYIDRLPPAPTGDQKADVAAILFYQRYLTERLNYIITLINKQEAENNGDHTI